MLPVLEQLLARIDQIKDEIGQKHDQLQVLELLWGDALERADCPDAGEAASLRGAMEDGVLEIQRTIRSGILGAGLRFPIGGLEHGLVDFPTTWDGRWVLLCWRRGENSVRFWHELDAGLAGRQPIDDLQARTMGSEIVPWPDPDDGDAES